MTRAERAAKRRTNLSVTLGAKHYFKTTACAPYLNHYSRFEMSQARCERNVGDPGPFEPYRACGKDAVHEVAPALYGQSAWMACPAHAREAALDDAKVSTVDHAAEAGRACLDGGDGCCVECGVAMVRCECCGGVGYHVETCDEAEAT